MNRDLLGLLDKREKITEQKEREEIKTEPGKYDFLANITEILLKYDIIQGAEIGLESFADEGDVSRVILGKRDLDAKRTLYEALNESHIFGADVTYFNPKAVPLLIAAGAPEAGQITPKRRTRDTEPLKFQHPVYRLLPENPLMTSLAREVAKTIKPFEKVIKSGVEKGEFLKLVLIGEMQQKLDDKTKDEITDLVNTHGHTAEALVYALGKASGVKIPYGIINSCHKHEAQKKVALGRAAAKIKGMNRDWISASEMEKGIVDKAKNYLKREHGLTVYTDHNLNDYGVFENRLENLLRGVNSKKINEPRRRVLKKGDKVIIVRAAEGTSNRNYVFGGDIDTAPLFSRGRLTRDKREDGGYVAALNNGYTWSVAPKEIELVDDVIIGKGLCIKRGAKYSAVNPKKMKKEIRGFVDGVMLEGQKTKENIKEDFENLVKILDDSGASAREIIEVINAHKGRMDEVTKFSGYVRKMRESEAMNTELRRVLIKLQNGYGNKLTDLKNNLVSDLNKRYPYLTIRYDNPIKNAWEFKQFLESLDDCVENLNNASGGKITVGSKAVITNGHGYTHTKEGSWGFVDKIVGDTAYIKFQKLTGEPHPTPVTFDINLKYIALMGKPRSAKQIKELKQKYLKELPRIKTSYSSIVEKAYSEYRPDKVFGEISDLMKKYNISLNYFTNICHSNGVNFNNIG